MRHASPTLWRPAFLAELGLIGSDEVSLQAVADVPIVTLAAGQRVARSRSGAPLTIIPLSGLLQADHAGVSTRFRVGSLICIKQTVLATGDDVHVEALEPSTVVLLDHSRLAQLVRQSPLFAQAVARALLTTDASTAPVAYADRQPLEWQDDNPSPAFQCALLVKMADYEGFGLCHGDRAVDLALRELGRVVRQSVRPGDAVISLPHGECLIGLHEDTMTASIVVRRLLARSARTVIFGDMRTPLPHLNLVAGVATAIAGENILALVGRARQAALEANRINIGLGQAPEPIA